MVKKYLVVLALVGCSASKQIAVEASAISERAVSICQLSDEIADVSTQLEVLALNAKIAAEGAAIQRGVNQIHKALPGVHDVTPWWAVLLQWVLVASVGGMLVWFLYSSGAMVAIRLAIGWIPRKKILDADMARATLDSDRPETIREWIAAKRSSDKEFDAAWRRGAETDGTSTVKA